MYMKPNPVRLNLIITGYSFNYSYVSVLQLIAKNIHDLQLHYCYYSYMEAPCTYNYSNSNAVANHEYFWQIIGVNRHRSN